MDNTTNTGSRLDDIINMLIEYSRANFNIRLHVTEEDDALNTVASGLNMLGEELAHYENQIIESRNFLQNILSSIDEIIYARKILPDDPASSPYSFISGRTEEIIGLSAQQLEENPKAWVNNIHPDDAMSVSGVLRKLLQGEEAVFTYRVFHQTKNEYIWLEDRVVPKLNEAGAVTDLYGSARDITLQRKTNLELQEKNELVSRLVATSDQFFYIVSLDEENSFINNFKFQSWQIEAIQGRTRDDIKKNPLGWVQAIHPDDLPDVEEANRQMFSTHSPVMRIYRVKHKKTGAYVWIEDYVVPVADDDGKIRELYGAVRDISERKKADLEKEQLIKELGNKFNEAQQFNYIVSHNLRAPVAHIIGLVKLLDMDMDEEELKDIVDYISEAAISMDELLNDLNTILSARSNLNEKIESFLLTDVINTISNNLKKEITTTDATINNDITPDANRISSIKSYVQSIIFNLVANAIRYRHQSRTPHILVSATRTNGRTIIKVKDNGIGMDLREGKNKDIFGFYSRLSDKGEGKGLGLYMTKTQVESLGGSISVESTPGKGSTFIVTL